MDDSPGLLAIFAHPDDESFRCGGTLALLAQHGWRIQLLTFTSGQAGSCGDPPICSPQDLGAMRSAELRCACAALGLPEPLILDYQDGTLDQVSDELATEQITAAIRQYRPQVLLTWPPDGLSGHPDHIAANRWSGLAFQQAVSAGDGAPIVLYQLVVPQSVANAMGSFHFQPVPDDEVSLTVDVMPVWEQKLAAIRCHRTQLGSSPILSAPIDRQKLFLGKEHFRRAAWRDEPDPLVIFSEARRLDVY